MHLYAGLNVFRSLLHPRRLRRERRLRNKGIEPRDFYNYDLPWLRRIPFDLILDIGAARGSHTMLFLELFPMALVHAFEPIPESFRQLAIKASTDKRIIPHPFALGDREGVALLNLSPYRDASSILAMTPEHERLYPGSTFSQVIEVPLKLLDSIIQLGGGERLLIKMDVQGAESFVISGGKRIFKQAEVVIAEVSFKRLYEGSPSFLEFCNLMESMDLNFVGLLDQTRERDGLYVQGDAIFVRHQTASF